MMKPFSKKIIAVLSISALPLLFVIVSDFLYRRRGWHDLHIQYETLYWFTRFLLSPCVLFYASWTQKKTIGYIRLIQILGAGFATYSLIFMGLVFLGCRYLIPGFDGRNLNLFNNIKDDTFSLNMFVFSVSLFIVWTGRFLEKTGVLSINASVEKGLHSLNESKNPVGPQQAPIGTNGNLVIKTGAKKEIVPVTSIFYLQSSGPYVKVITENKIHLVRMPLYELEAALPHPFLRIHRSCIVNASQITEIRSLLNGDYTLKLVNGKELRASRTYREALKHAMGGLPTAGA